jgi:hypothetical protein
MRSTSCATPIQQHVLLGCRREGSGRTFLPLACGIRTARLPCDRHPCPRYWPLARPPPPHWRGPSPGHWYWHLRCPPLVPFPRPPFEISRPAVACAGRALPGHACPRRAIERYCHPCFTDIQPFTLLLKSAERTCFADICTTVYKTAEIG